MLLRAVLQGYIDVITSGRALARRIKRQYVYFYLLGSETPNFRTINLFYKNYEDLIIQTQFILIKFAEEIGLKEIGALKIDRTKIKANTSSYNVADAKQLKALKKKPLKKSLKEMK